MRPPLLRALATAPLFLLALPLAFVALPLYVVLPNHYASVFGETWTWPSTLIRLACFAAALPLAAQEPRGELMPKFQANTGQAKAAKVVPSRKATVGQLIGGRAGAAACCIAESVPQAWALLHPFFVVVPVAHRLEMRVAPH